MAPELDRRGILDESAKKIKVVVGYSLGECFGMEVDRGVFTRSPVSAIPGGRKGFVNIVIHGIT